MTISRSEVMYKLLLCCLVQSPCDASTVFNTYFAENLQIYMLFVSVRPSCSPNLWQKHDQFLELQWKSQVFTQVIIIFASKAYEKKKNIFFSQNPPFFWASVETATTSGFFSASTGGEDPATSWQLDVVATPSKSLIWLQGFVETGVSGMRNLMYIPVVSLKNHKMQCQRLVNDHK